MNGTFRIFNGIKIKIKISKTLPDNEMYINPKTFKRMKKWVGKVKPNVWIQQGTVFNPNIELKRKFQKQRAYCEKLGYSIYITSGNDGDHSMRSMHYSDDAFDQLHNGLTEKELIKIYGKDFDIVEYSWGFHIEYDPK